MFLFSLFRIYNDPKNHGESGSETGKSKKMPMLLV